METVEIRMERRTGQGKGRARQLRRGGKVPAVLYGPKRGGAVSIAVSALEFERKLAHLEGSHLIRLVQPDAPDDLREAMVLLRESQIHPVSGVVLHADFYEVELTERLQVSVTLHFVGKAVGVVAGGILQPIHREIEVECLPTEIPDFVEVDVSHLNLHDAVHLGDLKLPEGVTAIGDPQTPLVTVVPPTVEAKPAEAAEAAPAEGAAPAAGAPAAPEAAGAKKGGEG